MTSWLRSISLGAFAFALASCGPADTQQSSNVSPDTQASSSSPLQALIQCDEGRTLDAIAGMRLAGQYANGKFYLPNEPTDAFGLPVAAVLVYDAVHVFGIRQPPTSGGPPELYTVTFLSAPGSAANPAFTSWAAARGDTASAPPVNHESGEVDTLVWTEASAIQSVTPGALPADLETILRGVGPNSVMTISRVITGGITDGSVARSINLEATETGSVSAVHCPGNTIFGGF